MYVHSCGSLSYCNPFRKWLSNSNRSRTNAILLIGIDTAQRRALVHQKACKAQSSTVHTEGTPVGWEGDGNGEAGLEALAVFCLT